MSLKGFHGWVWRISCRLWWLLPPELEGNQGHFLRRTEWTMPNASSESLLVPACRLRPMWIRHGLSVTIAKRGVERCWKNPTPFLLLHDCTLHVKVSIIVHRAWKNLPSKNVTSWQPRCNISGCPRQKNPGLFGAVHLWNGFRLKKEGVGIVFCLQEDKAGTGRNGTDEIWLGTMSDGFRCF